MTFHLSNCGNSCRLLTSLLVVAVAISWPRTTHGDCGPDRPAFYGYSFVDPALAAQGRELGPYFLSFGEAYENYFRPTAAIQQADNLTEWRDRFCEQATLDDIKEVIYEVDVGELRMLRYTLEQADRPERTMTGLLRENSFARHLARYRCTETVDYLLFARTCQPHVVAEAQQSGGYQDQGAMRNLIEDGQRLFNRTESHYIRLRYAYQLIRLAHYLKDYKLTLQLYDELMPKIDNDPSLVDYWIEGHRAGALQALGDNVKAAYLYSRIFDACPSKRESAYRSFTIRSDEEWERCLLLCSNDHERATLYVLRAQNQDARLLEEMNSIFRYDPQHPALEVLLVREMQRLEKDLMGASVNPQRVSNRRYYNAPRPIAGQRVIELEAFVRDVLERAPIPVARPTVWYLALGYLQTLAGNYYAAGQTFNQLQGMSLTDTLAQQLTVFRTALDILELDTVSDATEQQFYEQRRESDVFSRYTDLNKLLRDKLRQQYAQQGDEGKAFLLQYSLRDLRPNPQLELIDNLLTTVRNENRNRFEDQMLRRLGSDSTLLYDLIDLKATYYLQQLQVETAFELFKEIPRQYWSRYGKFTPFPPRFSECVHCPIVADTVASLNKGEAMQQVLSLEDQIRRADEPDEIAVLYFRLGAFYYNITYFGHSWRMADYFRSGSSVQRVIRAKGRKVFDYPGQPFGNREVFDCSRARYYFDRARVTARDPELAAQATYWAAKCERNEYYTRIPREVAPTYDNFALLKNEYANTEFYQRIIAECKYFRAYASR